MIQAQELKTRFDGAIRNRDRAAYEATHATGSEILQRLGAQEHEEMQRIPGGSIDLSGIPGFGSRDVPSSVAGELAANEIKQNFEWAAEPYRKVIQEALSGWSLAMHTDEVKALLEQVADSEAERDRNIRWALSTRIPVAQICQWTGLSRARVYQIRDGRR